MSQTSAEYHAAYYQANRERLKKKMRENYEATRQLRIERAAQWKRDNRAAHLEQTRKGSRRQRTIAPHRHAAHNAVKLAIARGDLVRLPCQICGNPRSEGHHADYAKPLEVSWFCSKHHKEVHRKIKESGNEK